MTFGLFLVAAGLAYYFYLKRATSGRIEYSLRGQNLVKGLVAQVAGLAMTHDGVPVDTVSTSWVALWNAGTSTIKQSDIAPGAPHIIESTTGSRILVATVVGQSDPVENIRVGAGNAQNERRLLFDYIDPGHGAIIQVIHTSAEWKGVVVEGKVMGGGPARLYVSPLRGNSFVIFLLTYFGIVGAVGVANSLWPGLFPPLIAGAAFVVGFGFFFLGVPLGKRHERRAGVPANLRQWWP